MGKNPRKNVFSNSASNQVDVGDYCSCENCRRFLLFLFFFSYCVKPIPFGIFRPIEVEVEEL